MPLVNEYYERHFFSDLRKHFVIVPIWGCRYADSVRHRIYPSDGDELVDRNMFAAFIYFFTIAQNVLLNDGGEHFLAPFLKVSRLPRLIPSGHKDVDPFDFLKRAELPLPDSFAELMESVSVYIYKEMELTLQFGRWRSQSTNPESRNEAELQLLAIPDKLKKKVLASFQSESYKYLLSCRKGHPEHPYPLMTAITGSILAGERYGLDGVVIFQRHGFNGLNAATKQYVSKLNLLKDDGDIKVYSQSRRSLEIVIVYNYSASHSKDEALKVFDRVLNLARQYSVKRLGMNGLELADEVKVPFGEGRGMMNLVKDVMDRFETIPFSEICFIDPGGAFSK